MNTKILSIALLMIVLAVSSCKKWLDVNADPNNPTAEVATAEIRLPAILAQFIDGYESAGTRAALLSGQLVATGTSSNNYKLASWEITSSAVNWPYQSWYIFSAVNIPFLYDAAEKVGAYHYIGVGKIIWAWGFGNLADMYGMVPYDEAFNSAVMSPKYDKGDHIYDQISPILDEAITYLQKTQEAGAPALSVGDHLYQGDTDKWIKLAYGLKARFLNHLSKTDKYDPDAILSLIAKGPQTVDESAIFQYIDDAVSGFSASNSLQYQNNSATRLTKLYLDYLLNNYTNAPSGSTNMEDPRVKILAPYKINGTASVRTKGVDASTLTSAGITSGNPDYLPLRPAATTTGTWYTAKGAKGLLLTSSEMQFIKAEIYFNKGNKELALQAYKQGIKDHFEILGLDATAFLASSSVIQNASALTLSHIMIQKYIALSYSPELFNDVRRMEYCTDASGVYNESVGIYKGFKRPGNVYALAFPGNDTWPRRFNITVYGISYNIDQVKLADPDATSATYTGKRIWWDVKK